jgi:DNA-binding MarR family transcriptional regulator
MAKLSSPQKYSPTPLHYLLFVLQHIADDQLDKQAGTTLSHVRIMGALSGHSSRSQKMVAMQLHQTEANVSRQLQTMKKQGLVNINKNNKDGRQRDVALSAKGKKKLAKAEKVLAAQHKRMLASLSARDAKAFDTSVSNLLKSI